MAKLSSIAYYVTDKISSNDISLAEYITTDCILQNKKGRAVATNLPPQPCSLIRYQRGDVLIANIRPYLKKVWFADINGGASPDVLVLRAKNGHSPSFLYAILLQDSFFDYVMQGTKGSKMPRGDKEQILRYEIPSFSYSEESIGTFFLNLDRKIRLNEQINQNLEAMAKQLYNYWFVQFDFPDDNGRPYKSSGGKMVWNEKLKREIPEIFEWCTLEDFIQLEDSKRVPLSSKERLDKKGIYPYYGATGIMDYVNDYIFDGDYLLLAEDGSTSDANGNPIVQYIWGKNWVNNHAHIVLPQTDGFILYAYQLLKNIPAKMIETGSIQKKISQENLLAYKIILPMPGLIKDYCKIVSPLWEQRKNNIEEILVLTKQRDELLPLLMNGQVSVNSDLSRD